MDEMLKRVGQRFEVIEMTEDIVAIKFQDGEIFTVSADGCKVTSSIAVGDGGEFRGLVITSSIVMPRGASIDSPSIRVQMLKGSLYGEFDIVWEVVEGYSGLIKLDVRKSLCTSEELASTTLVFCATESDLTHHLVKVGDLVKEGQALSVLFKLTEPNRDYYELKAPRAGVVRVLAAADLDYQAGEVLAVIAA